MQNLNFNDKIVNPDGTPTEYFMRLLQNRGVGQEDIETRLAALLAKQIIAGEGLDGGGTLGDPGDITIGANASAILDLISSTRGTVLYRGATGWAARVPGSANDILRTSGTGTDPTWAALSTLLDQYSTSQGAILYRNATSWVALAPGTSGQYLKTLGAGANPAWDTPTGASGAGALNKSSTATGTAANTTEQDLKTYTLPGGTLSADGMAIEIIASGTLAATSRLRTITVYFGASGSVTFSSASSTTVHWGVRIVIMRSGASEQRWFSTAYMGIGGANENPVHRVRNFTTSIDNTTNQVVKVTGQVGIGAVANDIICNLWRVELLS
jgi:uncharacterized protein (UPF0333 family)